jgi:hypothetical protein
MNSLWNLNERAPGSFSRGAKEKAPFEGLLSFAPLLRTWDEVRSVIIEQGT